MVEQAAKVVWLFFCMILLVVYDVVYVVYFCNLYVCIYMCVCVCTHIHMYICTYIRILRLMYYLYMIIAIKFL